MPRHISLSDVVLNRVCCLVSFRISLRELNSDLWLCMPQGFGPWCGPAQPDRRGPARPARPWRLCPPHACPLPLSLFPSFNSPAQQPPSLSHLSLSPRGALGFGYGDRRIWTPREAPLPSPLPLSLFPSPSPSSSPTRPPCARPFAPLHGAPLGGSPRAAPGARPRVPPPVALPAAP
jgi:hypothetical protein